MWVLFDACCFAASLLEISILFSHIFRLRQRLALLPSFTSFFSLTDCWSGECGDSLSWACGTEKCFEDLHLEPWLDHLFKIIAGKLEACTICCRGSAMGLNASLDEERGQLVESLQSSAGHRYDFCSQAGECCERLACQLHRRIRSQCGQVLRSFGKLLYPLFGP